MRFARVLAILAVAAGLPAAAAVPAKMSYQGYLTSAGVPVNATVSMTLKLYDAPTAGNLIWSETQSVDVANGIYNVVLGNTTPLDEAVLDGPRYLTVAVGGDADMAPRTPLASAPYAILAKALDGTIHPSQISAPLGTSLLEDGAVTFAKLAGGGCAPGKVIKRTVSSWECGEDIDTVGGVTASSPLQVTGGNVSLAGTVGVANGGTGLSSIATNGLVYGQGASAPGVTGAGSLGQVLTATAGGVPQWSNSAAGGLAISHPLQVAVQGVTFSGGNVGLGASNVLSVNGNQVVGGQLPGVLSATNITGVDLASGVPIQVATVQEINLLIARVNSLMNRLRSHGLISASLLAPGSSCAQPDECSSGICTGMACQSPLPLGSACSAPENCTSLLCSAGVCTVPLSPGAACTLGFQCSSGTCFGGICQ